jgi:hypothetical protein
LDENIFDRGIIKQVAFNLLAADLVGCSAKTMNNHIKKTGKINISEKGFLQRNTKENKRNYNKTTDMPHLVLRLFQLMVKEEWLNISADQIKGKLAGYLRYNINKDLEYQSYHYDHKLSKFLFDIMKFLKTIEIIRKSPK